MNEQELTNIFKGIMVEKGIEYVIDEISKMEQKEREDLVKAMAIAIGVVAVIEVVSK